MKDLKVAKILVPVDFSEHGQHALAMACSLARKYESAVTLLHVVQMPNVVLPEGFVLASSQTLATLFAHVAELLEGERKRAEALGIRASIETGQGNPWLEIVRYAEQHKIDLIVMGTHGRTGI